MIKEIKLPEIADNVETATVIKISVKKGDRIEIDDNIAEMESDKATFDLPADAAGVVKEIKVAEGDDVKVGQVVITIETSDEGNNEAAGEGKEKSANKEVQENESDQKEAEDDASDKDSKPEQPDSDESEIKKKSAEAKKEANENKEQQTAKSAEADDEVEKEADTDAETQKEADAAKEEDEKKEAADDDSEAEAEAAGDEKPKDDASDDEEGKEEASERKQAEANETTDSDTKKSTDVAASPSVRRLARELGIEVQQVEGTGPYSRITPDDVKAYAKAIIGRSAHKAAAAPDSYKLPDFSKYGNIERQPLSRIRQRTAANKVASWQQIPHVFHFDKADVTHLEEFRKKYGKKVEKEGVKITMTTLLLKIMGKALEAFPKFNASLDTDNGEVIYKKYYNIGVAVDTERGLLVPVVRNVDQKSIVQLSEEVAELAEKARSKKISPDELQGGNIAISNLGGIGGTSFTPIVYRPNVAILGVSRMTAEPVFIDGEFKPRLLLPLILSYDHRLIDGAEAARFLRWFCEALENPLLTMFKKGN